MTALRRFLVYAYDFVVGDDWLLALAVVAGLALASVLAARDVTSWWVLPLVVLVALSVSLARASRPSDAANT
jgi:uncharacterized membrane protein (UPF0136 family)